MLAPVHEPRVQPQRDVVQKQTLVGSADVHAPFRPVECP
jgi:hypothetical protein